MSAQTENGFTRIANEIVDVLASYRLPGEQMQCLLFILRKTYGYCKKVDYISSSQFCKATGINKGNVGRAIRGLVDKNIVVKKDNRKIPSYQFNKRYSTWKTLSKKTTVVKKDISVLSKKTPTKETLTKDKQTVADSSGNNEKYKSSAVFLANIISSNKNIKINGDKITKWANNFRLLVERDGVTFERLKDALVWYKNNIGDDYIPVAECGRSFREKFTKIEDAMKKTSKQNKDIFSGGHRF